MNKKVIELELVHSIEELIYIQEKTVKQVKKQDLPQSFINFQEDILKCLKVVSKIDRFKINEN